MSEGAQQQSQQSDLITLQRVSKANRWKNKVHIPNNPYVYDQLINCIMNFSDGNGELLFDKFNTDFVHQYLSKNIINIE